MNKNIDAQMTKKGYEKVQGVAILNDVATADTRTKTLSVELKTQSAVDIFNGDCGDAWQLYRLPETVN